MRLGEGGGTSLLKVIVSLWITFTFLLNVNSMNNMRFQNYFSSILSIADAKPIFIDETRSCHYQFVWGTPSLCQPITSSGNTSNGSGGLSGGAIAAIVLVVLAIVFVTIGVVIYRRRRQRRSDRVLEYSTNNDARLQLSDPPFYDDDVKLII